MKKSRVWVVAVLGGATALGKIGAIDMIGGTTHDFSTICAGIQRMVAFDPGYGVHAAWWYSATTGNTSFPDRNSRYNFKDAATGRWRWIDTAEYMRSGIEVFDTRNGYGSIDLDPVRHVPVISTHLGTASLYPKVARDTAAGAGVFEYCSGAGMNYLWPWCAVSAVGTVHLAMIDYETRNCIFHSRTTDWLNWSGPYHICEGAPAPQFSNQHITASKWSTKVAVVWEYSGGAPDPGFYRMSRDDGVTWDPVVDLGWPPTYGGDTLPSFHIGSFGSMFDRDDTFRIVAAVMPYIDRTGYVEPAEIWHYCEANTPVWSRIRRADPDTLRYPLGYNTIFACRPKIGQDPEDGTLYVIWSEYDPDNVEPVTELLRADVWASASHDNGQTWSEAVRLTDPDSSNKMYIDLAPVVNDTLHIVYLADLQAGSFVQGEGWATDNPIIYQAVPTDAVSIAEGPPGRPTRPAGLRVGPNPGRGGARLQPFGTTRRARLAVHDAAGRLVLVERPGAAAALDIRLRPGVYLVRLEDGGRTWTEKVTVVD